MATVPVPVPAPAPAPWQLDVSTPTLGVRVWLEDGKVCLHIGNDGARGAPCSMLVLPVTSADPLTLEPAIDLRRRYGSERNRNNFDRRYRRTPSTTLPSPYTQRYSRCGWCKLGPRNPVRLVVLMFHQGPLTREIAFPPTRAAVTVAATEDEELMLLESLFAPATRNPQWLQRGLVFLDPADLPGARQSKGPPPAFDATTFVVASCQYPAGLLDGTPPSAPRQRCGPADAAMLRLAARLRTPGADRPSLLVLAGDQVYVDATAGLFDPRARVAPAEPVARASREIENWLRIPYENWLGSAGALAVLGSVPTLMMFDDHEISDNWEPLPPPADPQAEADNEARKRAGVAAYVRYQRNDVGGNGLPTLWHTHEHRGLRFFMGDTRTERTPRRAALDPLAARIMSPRQTMALTEWLRSGRDRPSFVVTPAMLLPRLRSSARSPHGALHSDAWDGYPGSLNAMLALLCREQIENVVFLSGDAHLSFIARATVCDSTGNRVVIHSVHSSALYAPYPFANAVAADFEVPDAWSFEDPCDASLSYRVEVEVDANAWAPGDGFACLQVRPGAVSGWQVEVQFDRDLQRHPEHAARMPVVITL